MTKEVAPQSEKKLHKGRSRWRWIVGGGLLLTAGAAFVFAVYSQPSMTDDQYEVECRRLTEQGNWDELERVAGNWIDEAASLPDLACLFLADAQMELGKTQQAIDNLRRVPFRSPKSFAALIVACNLQFGELNQPQEGVETLKQMVEQRPSSATTHQRIIYFYAMTLQRKLMLDAIYAAINARGEPPDAYVYLMLGDHLSFTNGFEKNTEWLRSNPDEIVFQAARLVQLIENLQKSENKNATAALTQYQTALDELREKHPENLVLLRFSIEQAVNEFDVDRVSELVKHIPSGCRDSVLLRLQGWLKFQQGEFNQCDELLQQSITEFPLDWHTWQELAKCQRRLGNLEAAKQASEIALLGKSIRKEMLQLANAAGVSGIQLEKIALYAESCGMKFVSEAIRYRLHIQQQVPSSNE